MPAEYHKDSETFLRWLEDGPWQARGDWLMKPSHWRVLVVAMGRAIRDHLRVQFPDDWSDLPPVCANSNLPFGGLDRITACCAIMLDNLENPRIDDGTWDERDMSSGDDDQGA